MLSTLQKKPRTGIFKKTLFIFFFVFSTIFCKLNPFCKVPTSEYARRHAQIDLFTWRKWIRVGISTLQPLKVQGGQNTRFFLVCKNLTFNFYTEKGILISNKIGKLPSSLLNFDFCAQNIVKKVNFTPTFFLFLLQNISKINFFDK